MVVLPNCSGCPDLSPWRPPCARPASSLARAAGWPAPASSLGRPSPTAVTRSGSQLRHVAHPRPLFPFSSTHGEPLCGYTVLCGRAAAVIDPHRPSRACLGRVQPCAPPRQRSRSFLTAHHAVSLPRSTPVWCSAKYPNQEQLPFSLRVPSCCVLATLAATPSLSCHRRTAALMCCAPAALPHPALQSSCLQVESPCDVVITTPRKSHVADTVLVRVRDWRTSSEKKISAR